MNKMPKADISYYDDLWEKDENWGASNQERIDIVIDRVASQISDERKVRVLDVGCGNGWMLKSLQEKFGGKVELYGVEPSGVGAENARRKLDNATIWEGTIEAVVPDLMVDVIICSEVLEHVPYEKQADFMNRIAGFLVEGGVAVMTTPNGNLGDTCSELDEENQPKECFVTVEGLRELCADSFDTLELSTFNIAPYYKKKAMLRSFRKCASRLPVIWRCVAPIDRHYMLRKLFGFYQLIVLRKRK